MAIEKTLNTRIKLRIDTHEAWMLNDPVLLDGEIAIATLGTAVAGAIDNVPSVSMKVGQQGKKYSELDFMYARAADVLKACKKEADLKAFVNNVIKDAGLATDATIVEINADIDAIKKSLGELTTRVTTAEGKITALETASATHALKSELEAVDAKFADYTKTADLPKDLGDFTNNAGYAKTADVNGALALKADKEQVAKDIAAAITASENKEDAKFANYRKAADQDVIDAAQNAEIAKKADATQVASDIEAAEGRVDKKLEAYRTSAAQDEIDATFATKTELGNVDAKFASYTTTTAQQAIDAEQDRRLGVLEAKPFDTYATKTEVQDVADDLAEYVEANDAAVADRYTKAEADGKFALIADAYDDAEVRGLIGDNEDAINALAGKVGTVPEGQTVMGIITNIQENAYDDTELRGLIGDNSKAIADYIEANDKALADVKATAEAARTEDEVNSQIDAKITALDLANTYEPKGAEQNAKNYVDQKFTDANLDQYTTEAEVKSIVDTVITNAVEGDTLTSLTDLVEYLSEHGGEYAELAATVGDHENRLDAIEPKVEGWDATKATVDTNKATWDKAGTALQAADLADYAKTVDVVTNEEFTAFEATNTQAIATAKSDAITEAGKLDTALHTTITGEIATAKSEAIGAAKTETETQIGALKTELQAEIDTDVQVVADDLAGYKTSNDARVKAVEDDLAGYKTSNDAALAEVKATAEAARTETEVDDQIDAKITALDLTKKFDAKADKSVVDAMYTNTKIDELVAGAKSGAEDTAAAALATARTEISKEIDDDVKVVSDALAGVKTTADSAVQSVAAGDGLKATREGNAVTIAFDDACTFIFDCGTSK